MKVEDWSWQRTVRRVTTLGLLAAPYKRQTALAIISLLAATATALAPPYLAGLAIDDGIAKHDLHKLTIIVLLFVIAGVLNLGTSAAQTYFTGWTGERILADLRNTLFRHLQRLSLGFYERNRAGVIISRLTNDVEALDQLVTDGVTTLVQSTLFLFGTAIILFFLDWRLALATLPRAPADVRCDGASSASARPAPTAPYGSGSDSSRPRWPRTSAACASSSRSAASGRTSGTSGPSTPTTARRTRRRSS